MGAKIDRWQEGSVNRSEEHFELRSGSAENDGWDEWVPVAVIGTPKAGAVIVQFLANPTDTNAAVIRKVISEIQFYLLEVGKPDPWEYAKYHCGTSSNVYSDVHWSFVEARD
jgi:hypothetical protein